MIRTPHWLLATATGAMLLTAAPADARPQWSREQANAWYVKQRWLVGANFTPATAINQLEMWQAETWDPKRIDLELGWGQKLGMNTMRVFLHDQLWAQDPEGLKRRMEEFLQIAQRHGIKPLFVLFDSCWDPNPRLGAQHPPIPGVHNSGWVQSPGAAGLADRSRYPGYKAYVQGVIGAFANDDRVLGWDLWNEPDNGGGGGGSYPETPNKTQLVDALLDDVFDWARDANPSQPLTSGVWQHDDWSQAGGKLTRTETIQLTKSDIVTFHDYSWPEKFEQRMRQVMSWGRPVICTEYMARGNGSTFDTVLPIAKRANVGMMNWGFVDGRTQTRMPWDSWKKPYTYEEPTIWFHDVLHTDGTAYRAAETDLIRRLAAAPKGVVPEVAYAMPAAAPATPRRRRR